MKGSGRRSGREDGAAIDGLDGGVVAEADHRRQRLQLHGSRVRRYTVTGGRSACDASVDVFQGVQKNERNTFVSCGVVDLMPAAMLQSGFLFSDKIQSTTLFSAAAPPLPVTDAAVVKLRNESDFMNQT